jgi:hypothetical protein
VEILLQATGVPIDHYAYEAAELLRDAAARWKVLRRIRNSGAIVVSRNPMLTEDGRARAVSDPRRGARMTRTILLLAVVAMSGCASIGPATMTHDRFDYTEAVAESWKSQMLLNLVKIRYADAPVFLDVGQVVAGYSMQTTFSGSANILNTQGFSPGTTIAGFGLGAEGHFNDSPTVTYTPLAGENFARQMMTPIPPSVILNVIQAGFPVEGVFRLAVQAVNGVDNRRVRPDHVRPASPAFYALVQDLGRLQDAGAIGARADVADKVEKLTLVFRPNLATADESAVRDIAKILGLNPGTREFRVVYGTVIANDKEIALLTRSMLEVLTDISSVIAVPEAHVNERRVRPTAEADLGPDGPLPPLIRIASSVDRPSDAFVAVPYRGYWFSIDDRDVASKHLLSSLMFLFTFVQTGGKDAAPVLTIPTTR